MRLIERLYQYIEHKQLSFYAFERECGMANGYLKKQSKGKGTVGSDMLEKIHQKYGDLNLVWLLTGKGNMLDDHNIPAELTLHDEDQNGSYLISRDDIIILLREQVTILERSMADKEKIILMLETRLRRLKKPK
ncbi:MAG: hypothetical protein JST39_04655 [Bacteroidetes bacterium]|nr:hypothetical protein [Bacteroidota bacterium]